MQATSLIWAPSFCPKASGASQVRFQQLLARSQQTQNVSAFLCVISCLCLRLGVKIVCDPMQFCTWNVPGSPLCQRVFFVHSLCRGFLARADKTLPVLLLFLLSGSPTVGEKTILCRNYEIFRKIVSDLPHCKTIFFHSIASNVVIIIY